MALASTLKKLRLNKSKSLQDVADAIGASKAHVWELETGKSKNPSIDLLRRLADYYQTSISSLVGENPDHSEDERLVSMFRQMKNLDPADQSLMENMLKTLLNSRKESDDVEN